MMPREREQRPRLLIADDDATLAQTMRDILEEEFSVEVARDGSEAIDRVRASQPDVLVIDAEMPHLDGYAACRALRCDPQTADLPIIMVTGRTEPGAVVAAFEAGATDYLAKPFSLSQLRARTTTCLMRRRAS
jgi:putative two-component system response regulator